MAARLAHLSQKGAERKTEGQIGAYSPEAREERLQRHREKRLRRNFSKIRYTCRKSICVARPRVKGRFIKTGDLKVRAPEEEVLTVTAKRKRAALAAQEASSAQQAANAEDAHFVQAAAAQAAAAAA